MSKYSRIPIEMKYELFNISTNIFYKPLFYFLALMNAVFLKGVELNIFSFLIFVLTIIGFEFIFEILINPSLNRKQQNNLFKLYGLLSLPSLIPFAIFRDYTFLVIPITFAVLAGLLEIVKDKFSSSRRILLTSLISFFLVFFLSSSNINYIIIQLLLLALFTLAPVRLVQHIPAFYTEIDDYSQKVINDYKRVKEKIPRYSRNFRMENTTPIILNESIYFATYNKIYDEQAKEVKDQKIKNELKKILKAKNLIIKIFEKYNIKSNRWDIVSAQLLMSLFFSYELLKHTNKFIFENYDNLNFVGKSELDKQLTKSDIELSIIHDDLEEYLFKLLSIYREFINIPSNNLLNLIQKLHKIASNKIIENQIKKRIDNRVEIAEKLYKNKKNYLLGSFYKMRQSIEKEINVINEFKFS